MGSFLDSKGKNIEGMARYWIDTIRNGRDDFRNYVSNPALYGQFDTLDSNLLILDVGCGEGYVSRELTRRGHRMVGIDESPYMIKAAAEASVGGEEYMLGDAYHFPIADGLFDAVVSNFLLVELEYPDRFVGEVARVLKPHGRLLAQTIHPSLFISKTGEADGMVVEDYHVSQAHTLPIINVNPNEAVHEESPSTVKLYHHSLETYVTALINNGFYIRAIKEPRPTELTPLDHEVRKLLKDPRIILIDAEKINNTEV